MPNTTTGSAGLTPPGHRRPCDTLVLAECVVTQNHSREVVRDGGVAVADGTILAVDTAEALRAAFAPAATIDLGPALVLPGLINAHTHAPMSLFRGLADDLPLMDWLTEHIWPAEKQLTRELVHLGSLLSCAEMIRTGTTCFCDMYLFEAEVARAADRSGLRAVVGEGVFTMPTPSYTRIEDAWEIIASLEETYRDHPRIRTAIMAHAVYTTTPEALRRSFELAERHDCPWMIHLAETTSETEACLDRFGLRPVAYLSSLGLLTPRTRLAHGVDLDEAEIDLLARAGVGVVHCPESNMKLASGVAPVEAMRRAGVLLGLGTDGAASNNNLDMFTEMASAALLQKVTRLDPTALPAQAALDMATHGGAACLGWPGLGSLAPGRPADLVALDLTQPGLQPLYNPVSQAVYAASGNTVILTMVDGRVLYRDGAYATLDYPLLLGEIRAAGQWVLDRL